MSDVGFDSQKHDQTRHDAEQGGEHLGNAAGRPGMSGVMGGGTGAGASKDEKKTRKRKYEPFRIDDEDELPPGYVNPMSQTYGSDKDITPAPTKDDGWDPRQW